MAQKVTGYIKLQIPAAKATASPPVGPALGQHGVNIAQFIREFNDRTKDQAGFKIPVVITVYADRSFSFVTKTPPTPTLILKAIGQEKGSGVPNKNKVGTITKAQVREIAEQQNARPHRRHHRGRDEPGCRHLPQHGHRRCRLIAESAEVA